jgi:hypothetical protein
MSISKNELDKLSDWKDMILYVVAWLASTVLLAILLVIVRGIAMDIMTWIGLSWEAMDYEAWRTARLSYGWVQEFVDRVVILIMGCVAVVAMVWIEYYYRKGMHKGELVQRIARVVVTELIFAALSLAISAGLALLLAVTAF